MDTKQTSSGGSWIINEYPVIPLYVLQLCRWWQGCYILYCKHVVYAVKYAVQESELRMFESQIRKLQTACDPFQNANKRVLHSFSDVTPLHISIATPKQRMLLHLHCVPSCNDLWRPTTSLAACTFYELSTCVTFTFPFLAILCARLYTLCSCFQSSIWELRMSTWNCW